MKKAALFTAGLLLISVLLFIGVVFVSKKYMNEKTQPQMAQSQSQLERWTPFILSDLQLLSSQTPFKSGPRLKNANSFLTPHMARIPKEVDEFFKKYSSWLNSKEDFEKMLADPTQPVLDTAWVDDLKSYDHWNFMQSPEVLAQIKKAYTSTAQEKISILTRLPVPEMRKLQLALYLRFIYLHKSGQTLEGLKLFRTVAELFHSTNSVVGNMLAATLLRQESKIAVLFPPSTEAQWVTVPENVFSAYQRVTWAWIAIFKNAYFGNYKSDFDKYIKPELGVCPSIVENLTVQAISDDYFLPKTLFEDSWEDQISSGLKIAKLGLSVCNSDEFIPFYERSSTDAETPWVIHHEGSTSINYARIPYIRRMVGSAILQFSEPSGYFKLYEEAHPSQKAK